MYKSQFHQTINWIKMLPLLFFMLVFLKQILKCSTKAKRIASFIIMCLIFQNARSQQGGYVQQIGTQITADTCIRNTGSFIIQAAPGSNWYSAITVQSTTFPFQTYQPSNMNASLFENLPAGIYDIIPIPFDPNDLAYPTTVTIDSYRTISFTSNINQPTCTVNGLASINLLSGVAPITYLWDNNATVSSITLPQGSYNRSVRITGADGCYVDENFQVYTPSTVFINPQVIQPTCSVNGSIVLNAAGSAPFTYLWSNNATTATLNPAAGNYLLSVTVTGNDGCIKTETFNIQTNQNPRVYISSCDNYVYNGITYTQSTILNENSSQNGCIENRQIHINIYPSNTGQLTSSNLLFNCIDSAMLTVSGNNENHIKSINWLRNGVSLSNTQANVLTTIAGGNGEGSAFNQFGRYSSNIAVDHLGNTYVSDPANYRVLMFPPNSTSATQGIVVAGGNGFGVALNQLPQPGGLFVKGNFLYVADVNTTYDRIMKFPINPYSPTGTGVIVAHKGVIGHQIFVSASDELYTSRSGANEVSKYPANSDEFTDGIVVAGSRVGLNNCSACFNSGSSSGSALNQLTAPQGIWVKPNGDLYIADGGNNRIVKWQAGATSGVIVAGGNGIGNTLNQIEGPRTIIFDALGDMYVLHGSSYPTSRVSYFQSNSNNNSNGNIFIDNISSRSGLAFDNNGKLLIVDGLNFRVVRLDKQLTKKVYQTGTYTAEVTMDNGCIYNVGPITITRNVALKDTIRLSSCGNVYYNGMNYNTSTTLRDTFRTTAGCDSLYRVIYITIPTIPNASISNGSNVSLGTTLNLANAATAKQIDWYNNGVKVATVHHASNITPTTAAGGNGWGSANNQASYPYGICIDRLGNLYTVNTHFHSIEKWDAATNAKTIVAGSGNQYIYGRGLDQLFSPRGVFVDDNFNVYVADGENHRVVKWAPGATSGIVVAGGNYNIPTGPTTTGLPSAVFVDAAGNIYVACEDESRIQKWAPGATSGVTVAGVYGYAPNRALPNLLYRPAGVYVTSNGDIYVADMFNNRVQKFAAGSTTATTVAGQADGSAGNDACHLHYPHAVYVDANGNVFVADGYNSRVQMWAPGATSGITVAGGIGNGTGAVNGIEGVYLNTAGDIYAASVVDSKVTKWINPNPTINTTFTPTTTGNYYAVLTFDNCCQLTTNAIDVNAFRPGTPITGNPKSCTLNTTSNLSNKNKNGVWQSSNTSVATISSNGVVTSLSNGTTQVSYKYSIGGDLYLSTIDFTVASLQNPVITGAAQVCVGSSIQLSGMPVGGIWSSLSSAATINNAGLLTGVYGGSSAPAIVKYTITNANGCMASATYSVTVNPVPLVPTIAYAPGTSNPKLGAGGGFCLNRTFGVIGIPSGGVWTSSNNAVITVSNLGIINTVGLGVASLNYKITNNGCSNSRYMGGTVVGCVYRSMMLNDEQAITNDFVMYPNPAKSVVSLQVDKVIGSGSIVITDLYGKMVKHQGLSLGINTLDVSNLSKGVYLVSMITNDGKNTKKLIVE